MDKLALAVIGVGRMGSIHAANAAHNPCVDLRALVDIDKEKAQQKASTLSVPSAYESIDEMLENEKGEIQAAVIATPTSLHVPHALALLKADYKVLLEKPLAPSPADARELMKYLGRRRNLLMHGFQRRFDPAYLYAKKIIDAGTLGRIFKIESRLENDGPPPTGYESHGILVDMGVHLVDLHYWLLGREAQAVRKVTARGSYLYQYRNSRKDFDDARLETELGDGVVLGIINVSRNRVAGYVTETMAYGSEGEMTIRGTYGGGSVVVKVTKPKWGVVECKRFKNKMVWPGQCFLSRHGRAYWAELDYFARQCLRKGNFCVTHIEGMKALNVCYEGQHRMT